MVILTLWHCKLDGRLSNQRNKLKCFLCTCHLQLFFATLMKSYAKLQDNLWKKSFLLSKNTEWGKEEDSPKIEREEKITCTPLGPINVFVLLLKPRNCSTLPLSSFFVCCLCLKTRKCSNSLFACNKKKIRKQGPLENEYFKMTQKCNSFRIDVILFSFVWRIFLCLSLLGKQQDANLSYW